MSHALSPYGGKYKSSTLLLYNLQIFVSSDLCLLAWSETRLVPYFFRISTSLLFCPLQPVLYKE